MRESFSMSRAEVIGADADTLKATILEATGSESSAESILRSLERMRSDASIRYFDVTEVSQSRREGGFTREAWRVSADRGLSMGY